MSTEIQRIHERIDDMHETLHKLASAVKTLTGQLGERCPGQIARVARLELRLDGEPGNGDRPGLDKRLDRLDKQVSRLERRWRTIYAVGGAVGTLLIERIGHWLRIGLTS